MIFDTLLTANVANGASAPAQVGKWLRIDSYFRSEQLALGFQLVTDGNLAGAWKVETSNAATAETADASPSDVTANFSGPGVSSIATVAGASSQGVQSIAPSAFARYLRFSFVPTSGSGNVSVLTAYPSGQDIQSEPFRTVSPIQSSILSGSISGTTPLGPMFVALARRGRFALQLATTGTVAGTWKVFGSNKSGADVNGDASASDVTAAFETAADAPISQPAGSPTSQLVQAGDIFFAYVGAQFTPSSGSGTAVANGNEIGT
jgi:hypothetical protein